MRGQGESLGLHLSWQEAGNKAASDVRERQLSGRLLVEQNVTPGSGGVLPLTSRRSRRRGVAD